MLGNVRYALALVFVLADMAGASVDHQSVEGMRVQLPQVSSDLDFQTPCLCIFDIDRTLTGKQGARREECPSDTIQTGIFDNAYGGGTLKLSELGQNLAGTFCNECFLGTISAGNANGPGSKERALLQKKLSGGDTLPASTWNPKGCRVKDSPLVTGCWDGLKPTAVPGIQKWYRDNKGVTITDNNVYFFDDRAVNIESFRIASFMGRKYNARQISCFDARDYGGAVGLCGARLSEIKREPGAVFCKGAAGELDNLDLMEVETGRYVNATLLV